MTTNPTVRAERLFDALQKLSSAKDKAEAVAMRNILENIHNEDARSFYKALCVLVEEWPE